MAYSEQRHPPSRRLLSPAQTISLQYHDIFGWPLKEAELARWLAGKAIKLRAPRSQYELVQDFYLIKGKSRLVAKRLAKEQASREKMKLLAKAKPVFENDDNILMVGITGSLAMNAASVSSDIDLLVITAPGSLWTTRVKTLLTLRRLKFATRTAGDRNQKDRLCLNIWMDVQDLVIDEKNPYTAHELSQIVPFINKNRTYEKLITNNYWIKDYWPNATLVAPAKLVDTKTGVSLAVTFVEKIAYVAQRLYMFRKKTQETITPTRAFFHPRNLSRLIKKELSLRGIA